MFRWFANTYFKEHIDNIVENDPIYTDAATVLGAANLLVNQNEMGAVEYVGGRISALWKPSDKLSVNLQYVTQDGEQIGFTSTTGDYTQTRLQFGGELSGKQEGVDAELDFTNLVAE